MYKQLISEQRYTIFILLQNGTKKKEIATAMSWKRNDGKAGEVKKFHGKYVLLTSLDEEKSAS